MTLVKGEDSVTFVSDRECDQKLEELTTGMSRAFDYNLGMDWKHTVNEVLYLKLCNYL